MARKFATVTGVGFIFCASISIVSALSLIDLRGVSFAFNRPIPGESLESSLSQNSEGELILQEAVDILSRNPGLHVYVTGHADASECVKNNCQSLSSRRAQLVYDWLIAHGVDATQLEGQMGFGDTQSIDFSDTEEQRRHNRRVDLRTIYPK